MGEKGPPEQLHAEDEGAIGPGKPSSRIESFGSGGNPFANTSENAQETAPGGGPPTPEQSADMQRLQARFKRSGQRDLTLILIAAATMATARYW